MDSNTRCTPNSDNLTSTVIDGEAVIVNLTTGVYYSMDGTGGLVWQMIEEGRSLDEMATVLAIRYETTREQALGDLTNLVARLKDETRHSASTAAGQSGAGAATGARTSTVGEEDSASTET